MTTRQFLTYALDLIGLKKADKKPHVYKGIRRRSGAEAKRYYDNAKRSFDKLDEKQKKKVTA